MKLGNGRLFQSLFENLMDGFTHCEAIYDEQGHLIDYLHVLANDAYCLESGLGNPVGKKESELLPELYAKNKEIFEIYERVSKGGKPEIFESYVASLNKWFEISVYCVEEGTFTVVFRNVTEHKEIIKTIRDFGDSIERAYEESLLGIVRALQFRDFSTEQHSNRVMKLTIDLARSLSMSETDIACMKHGALLHDIGKLFISDAILLKPGKLTAEEEELMRQHTLLGFEFLKPIIRGKQSCIDIPHYHHERWDGSGYPEGLAGINIPLSARIFAVVDVFDAMTSDRPYRKMFSDKFTLTYISTQSGILFDPDVVSAFVSMMDG